MARGVLCAHSVIVRILIVLQILGLTLQASAQNPAILTKPESAKRPSNKIVEGLGIKTYYSTAQELLAKFGDSEVAFESTGALGVGAQYASIGQKSLGYAVGASFEQSRTLERVKTKSGDGATWISVTEADGTTLTSQPRFSLVVLEANATYGVIHDLYAMGGVNYPLINGSTGMELDRASKMEIQSSPGFQLGVGYLAIDSFSLEGIFRALNLPVSVSNSVNGQSAVGQGRLWGFSLSGTYTF